MNEQTRREFMRTTGSAVLGSGLAAGGLTIAPDIAYGSYADPERPQPPTLVVLYLRGGADPLSTIVPAGDPLYYEIRPTISIPLPANATEENPGLLQLTDYFGMHPAMKEMHELYHKGTLAPIMCVGSTHPTRSHFDAQDFMERAAPGVKTITEGWLNRYLYDTKKPSDGVLRSVSLQPTLPRSLRGQYSVLAVPDYGVENAMNVFDSLYNCEGDKEAARQMYQPVTGKWASGVKKEASKSDAEKAKKSGPPTAEMLARQRIVEAGADGIAKLRFLNSIIRRNVSTEAKYPGGHLSNQFRDLAKIIKANVGLEVAAIDYNGWDHHAYQGGSVGTMANMLGNVSKTLKAFVDDLGERMNKTMVLVMSEFGRTVHENGNNGSDHGRGGFMLAIGGPVKGGRIYGDWTGLQRANLYEKRDLPVHVDFRIVFAEALRTMYGFDPDRHDFFPKFRAGKRMLNFTEPLEHA